MSPDIFYEQMSDLMTGLVEFVCTYLDDLLIISNATFKVDENIFPVHLEEIQHTQTNDRDLSQKIKTIPSCFQKTAVEQVEIITYKDRIYICKDLRIRIMKWYHHYLCYPGDSRMHKILVSILYWEKREDKIRKFIKQCPTCQRFKKKKRKKKIKTYGKISPKNVELISCDTVCIDIVGPYTVTDQKGNDRNLNVVIFVDLATGWFEIAEITDKTCSRINQIFNNTWLSLNSRPRKLIFDNENEFKKDFLPLLGIKPTPTIIKNPQDNSIMEK